MAKAGPVGDGGPNIMDEQGHGKPLKQTVLETSRLAYTIYQVTYKPLEVTYLPV